MVIVAFKHKQFTARVIVDSFQRSMSTEWISNLAVGFITGVDLAYVIEHDLGLIHLACCLFAPAVYLGYVCFQTNTVSNQFVER